MTRFEVLVKIVRYKGNRDLFNASQANPQQMIRGPSLKSFTVKSIAIFCFVLLFAACSNTPKQKNEQHDHGEHHMHHEHTPAKEPAAHEQHMHHGAPADTNPKQYADRENAAVKSSADGHYRVSLFSDSYPLPMQKIHSWTVHIETAEGKPLEGAKVRVHGGMPAHGHGFPTQPRVTDYLGNGDYKVEGIKFSMGGHWEIRFNIREVDRRDRVVFDIHLD